MGMQQVLPLWQHFCSGSGRSRRGDADIEQSLDIKCDCDRVCVIYNREEGGTFVLTFFAATIPWF